MSIRKFRDHARQQKNKHCLICIHLFRGAVTKHHRLSELTVMFVLTQL